MNGILPAVFAALQMSTATWIPCSSGQTILASIANSLSGISNRTAGWMRAASCSELGCADITGCAGRNPHCQFSQKTAVFLDHLMTTAARLWFLIMNSCISAKKYIPIYLIWRRRVTLCYNLSGAIRQNPAMRWFCRSWPNAVLSKSFRSRI